MIYLKPNASAFCDYTLTFSSIYGKIPQVATNRFCTLRKGSFIFSTPQRGKISIEKGISTSRTPVECYVSK